MEKTILNGAQKSTTESINIIDDVIYIFKKYLGGNKKMELKEGDKYLSIKIELGKAQSEIFKAIRDGKDAVDFVAYKNEKHETNPQSPHYRSSNVAVWVNKKKTKKEEDVK